MLVGINSNYVDSIQTIKWDVYNLNASHLFFYIYLRSINVMYAILVTFIAVKCDDEHLLDITNHDQSAIVHTVE